MTQGFTCYGCAGFFEKIVRTPHKITLNHFGHKKEYKMCHRCMLRITASIKTDKARSLGITKLIMESEKHV